MKDDNIEAVFVATDAPSHARHVHAKFSPRQTRGFRRPRRSWLRLKNADKLFHAVKSSGRKYMMFETSAFHEDLYAMRQIYHAGGLGRLVYSEGEYFHYMPEPIDSYQGWRIGLPPQLYPTHSNAYYVCVTGGSFTEVSCQGMPSVIHHLQPENNVYKNRFGTEIALFRTSEGGMSRMGVSWDTPGGGGEMGRTSADEKRRASTVNTKARRSAEKSTSTQFARPLPLPGRSGQSRRLARLPDERVRQLAYHLQDRKPLVDIATRLEPDRLGHRCPSIFGIEGWRDAEDPAV